MRRLHDPRETIPIDALLAFVETLRHGSFAAGARALDRDASAITRRVQQLEKILGVRLFERDTRRMRPTAAGRDYYARVAPALETLAAAAREAAASTATPRGVLKVTVPHTFGHEWLAPRLPAFLSTYPDIEMELNFDDRYADLIADGFDAAVRVGRVDQPGTVARRIATFRRRLFAAPGYLASHGAPATPEALAAHRGLGFANASGARDWTLTDGRATRRVAPRWTLLANDAAALLAAAEAGQGIVAIADWLAASALARGALVPVLPAWRLAGAPHGYLLLPSNRRVGPATRAFAEWLADAARREPAFR